MSAARLLDEPRRIYLACTGAGAGLQRELWNVPGISRVLVGAEFPYAAEATDRFLGYRPASYCSESAAIALAVQAYYRAFRPGAAPAVGLGLTASVATTREHRGDHRVHVATITARGCRSYSATLEKGHGTDARLRDGSTCDALALAALLVATGQPGQELALETERLECESRSGDQAALAELLARPLWTAAGTREPAPTTGNGLTVFPGAFNPPHDGHLSLAREFGATFHVTIDPPHKPALSAAEVIERARQLEGFPRLFTLGDPLYLDKARRLPGARILLGADALARLLDPAWGEPIAPMVAEFRGLGIRFLVADREVDQRLLSLDAIRGAPADLCQRVLRPAQHLALASTALRAAFNPV